MGSKDRKRTLIKAFHLLLTITLPVAAMVLLMMLLGGWPTPVTAAPAATPHYLATTRYVATTGADGGTCNNPASPCQTVQYAVDQSGSGDEIRVAAGTYTDTVTRTAPSGYHGPSVITQVVSINKSLTIRGGYTTADNFAASDPQANPTTLDAEGGKRVVLAGSDGSTTVRLENLRITGGDAAGLGSYSASMGGSDAGGGVYVFGDSTRVYLDGNDIYSNTAEFGGGVCVDESGGDLSGNTIYSNTVRYDGGGVHLMNSRADLSGNDVYDNAAGTGGGISVAGGNHNTLENNTVYSNTAVNGGGVYVNGSLVELSGNTIYSNTTTGDGGGVYAWVAYYATFSGNAIHNNTAGDGGGVYARHAHYATFSDNAIYSNTVSYGGGIYLYDLHSALC